MVRHGYAHAAIRCTLPSYGHDFINNVIALEIGLFYGVARKVSHVYRFHINGLSLKPLDSAVLYAKFHGRIDPFPFGKLNASAFCERLSTNKSGGFFNIAPHNLHKPFVRSKFKHILVISITAEQCGSIFRFDAAPCIGPIPMVLIHIVTIYKGG